MPPYESINLHPQTHLPSSLVTKTYDVICLGSGWAGRILAARAVRGGLSAIIVEEELVGGDCPFWACVPSKVLLRPQEVVEEVQAVGGARERFAPTTSGQSKLDVRAVLDRRDTYSSHWDDGVVAVPMVEGSGAALVRGTGTITGVKEVHVRNVNGQEVLLQANHAVAVCTGSEPIIPPIPGLEEAKPWGARQATSSSSIPESLLVLGAGAVGTEMATAYASFGSNVILVTKSSEILSGVDPEAGLLVRQSLESQGVKVVVSATASSVKREADGTVTVKLTNEEVFHVSEILVASGRKARTEGLGLEQFGLHIDGSPLTVDESLCISAVPGSWLYALGDVNGRAPLTHSSKYHGRIAGSVIIARANGSGVRPVPWSEHAATADLKALPQVIFTNPNVATVGLTRGLAKKQGKTVREVTAPLVTLGAKLHADGFKDGWAQWIIEEGTDRLLGATFVGANAADLLHASTVAVVGGLTLDRLAHAIPSFPTMSEVYLNLLEAAGM
ncbi:pyruvate/2-oxoglutarate dehydrogenase [Thozetella sp. PMI_491]|nr:pyruvate/2-oxoglutarate dehydrogenase [Thozetella sp. PMI_491]